jgi:ABC-type multidrug transport system ATPase subunit
MEEAMAVCNEILILDHGHVVASGDLATLLKGTAESGPFANLEALFMHNTQRSLRD